MDLMRNVMKKISRQASFLLRMSRFNYSVKGFAWYLMHLGEDRELDSHVTVLLDRAYEPRKEAVFRGLENVGIVLQGPIMHEDDFTVNSVKRYRSIYPDIQLVVSTWEGDLSSEERTALEQLRCHIIESKSLGKEDKGKGRKIAFLNNQIRSSFAGVEYLKEHHAEYVMKIRSDLRIDRVDFIPYLLDTMKLYTQGMMDRVVNVAFSNSMVNVPFHMSDFAWFGPVDRMYDMYSVPYRTEEDLRYVRERTDDNAYFGNLY